MEIHADRLSKRFGRQWVIRDFTFVFEQGVNYAIEGPNGSGKSTLLHLCCTYLEPTKGSCQFINDKTALPTERAYKHFSIAAPYLDLIPHFTIREQMNFTEKLKSWSTPWTTPQLIELMGLEEHAGKLMRSLSSGMRQRVRLVSALAAKVDVVFLDEPTTNLDPAGKEWYQEVLPTLGEAKTLLIASNEKEDLRQCTERVDIENFK